MTDKYMTAAITMEDDCDECRKSIERAIIPMVQLFSTSYYNNDNVVLAIGRMASLLNINETIMKCINTIQQTNGNIESIYKVEYAKIETNVHALTKNIEKIILDHIEKDNFTNRDLTIEFLIQLSFVLRSAKCILTHKVKD